MIHYRRSQISCPAVIPLVLVMLILAGVFIATRILGGLVLVAVVTTLILLLFATMTVTMDDQAIEASAELRQALDRSR